jgi:predicted protein tyrosine phosphatase
MATKKYIDQNKYILPFEKGDILFITQVSINRKTGKPFAYNYVRRVLQDLQPNKQITAIAENWLKNKEEFRKQAAKLSA